MTIAELFLSVIDIETQLLPYSFIHSRSTLSTGTLKFPDHEKAFTFTATSLRDCGKIGSGNFGSVYKMIHIESGREMAVKVRHSVYSLVSLPI